MAILGGHSAIQLPLKKMERSVEPSSKHDKQTVYVVQDLQGI